MPSSSVDLSEALLGALSSSSSAVCSLELSGRLGVSHQAVVGAVKSLQSLGDVVDTEQRQANSWSLTKEGEQVREGDERALHGIAWHCVADFGKTIN